MILSSPAIVTPPAPWRQAATPTGSEPWLANPESNLALGTTEPDMGRHLGELAHDAEWHWPDKPVYFISDIHADAGALLESLEMVGLIERTGPRLRDFAVTQRGHEAAVIVGGDCLDKGPSNLKLLNTLRRLAQRGLGLQLLAGNHDLRLALGLAHFSGPTDTRTEHLFLRMGSKTMPLLHEIWQRRLANKPETLSAVPSKKECRQRLLPRPEWPEHFKRVMANKLSEAAMDREIQRILEKRETFKSAYKTLGMGLRQVYAAAQEAHRMFIQPRGKYAWFLPNLKLVAREGSFLFAHAGLDDDTAGRLAGGGTEALNQAFQREFKEDPFACYAGPLGNTLRTKYRPVDYPLTDIGSQALREAGIYAVVHGHRSNQQGQRLALRSRVLHIECDITLDRNSRRLQGMADRGAGITVIRPEGCVWGISSDHPRVKLFDPLRAVPPERSNP